VIVTTRWNHLKHAAFRLEAQDGVGFGSVPTATGEQSHRLFHLGVAGYRQGTSVVRGDCALPQKFRALCEDLVIRIEDFATDEVLDDVDIDDPFDVLGLFQGVGLFRAESAPTHMRNMIWLNRRPILDDWSDHEESLGAVVHHVLVHEIGHDFGLSDDDMEAIEADAD
jgi:predicted Zn-dependent protease with MMP-like domain